MPFTPAHVAAVLPFVGRARPGWAVPSALVIGSMVPDALYFVPVRSDREFSHSLAGILTLDLALGLLLVGLWRVVAAPVLRDLVPLEVHDRVPAPRRPTSREWLWAGPGLVLGSLTHVVWDGFTHSNGWAVRLLPVLTETVVRGQPAFKLAQYASGLVGVVLVVGFGLRALAVSSPDHRDSPLATPMERTTAWLALVVVPVLSALVFAVSAERAGASTEVILYTAVVRGVSALGVVATGVAVWWHCWVRPHGAPPAEPTSATSTGRTTGRSG